MGKTKRYHLTEMVSLCFVNADTLGSPGMHGQTYFLVHFSINFMYVAYSFEAFSYLEHRVFTQIYSDLLDFVYI